MEKSTILYHIQFSSSPSEAEFPVFDLCPSYMDSYKPEVLSQDGLTVEDIRNMSYPKDKKSADYHRSASHNITELIKKITFKVKSLCF